MTDSKDDKKKDKRAGPRRDTEGRGDRRDPSKKNSSLEKSRRKETRRTGKDQRG